MVYWLSSYEIKTVTRVQIPDKDVSILHSANTIRKGLHPAISLTL